MKQHMTTRIKTQALKFAHAAVSALFPRRAHTSVRSDQTVSYKKTIVHFGVQLSMRELAPRSQVSVEGRTELNVEQKNGATQ